MASLGIEAIAQYAKDGTKPQPTARQGLLRYRRVARDRQAGAQGVESIDVKTGTDKCWG